MKRFYSYRSIAPIAKKTFKCNSRCNPNRSCKTYHQKKKNTPIVSTQDCWASSSSSPSLKNISMSSLSSLNRDKQRDVRSLAGIYRCLSESTIKTWESINVLSLTVSPNTAASTCLGTHDKGCPLMLLGPQTVVRYHCETHGAKRSGIEDVARLKKW